jgi:hypothetical protein
LRRGTASLIYKADPPASTPPPDPGDVFEPSLDFSDDRNSMYAGSLN